MLVVWKFVVFRRFSSFHFFAICCIEHDFITILNTNECSFITFRVKSAFVHTLFSVFSQHLVNFWKVFLSNLTTLVRLVCSNFFVALDSCVFYFSVLFSVLTEFSTAIIWRVIEKWTAFIFEQYTKLISISVFSVNVFHWFLFISITKTRRNQTPRFRHHV